MGKIETIAEEKAKSCKKYLVYWKIVNKIFVL